MFKRAVSGGMIAVTFSVPAELGARRACLVGSCTAWAEVPMNPREDGSFELVVELPAEGRHTFRYLLDGERWENDWTADDYVPNAFGGDDSVVLT
jgi:hypothetical protein